MPTYVYKAMMTKTGVIVKNKVEAASRQNLLKTLKDNGLLPIEIVQVKYSGLNQQQTKSKRNIDNFQDMMQNLNTTNISKNKPKQLTAQEKLNMTLAGSSKIPIRDIMVFTQNFYLLKKANFNNIHALSTIIESTEHPNLKGILQDILAGVEAGEYMYTTMEYYSNTFPYIYINMIKVGELSGSLVNSLEQAVKYLDESTALSKKIRSILIPNIIQFALLLVMLFVGTLVAIPAIQGVFDEVGSDAQLPAPTMWFSGVVNNLIAYWYIPLSITLAIAGGIIFYINTPRGKYNFHYFKYRMPIFGELIFALDFSRFLKAMLLNLKNGMRIQESIEVSKNVINNLVMLSIIETSINNILAGGSWIEPFEQSGLAKPMIIEMLKIGMQTDLAEMMEKLVEYMQIDIDNIMQKIMKALPQVVYSIVGIVLIFFVVVVLVPVIQVYMGNFLFDAYGV